VSCGRLCQFIFDLMSCRDWYGSDNECILDKDEICEIVKFLAADGVIVICVFVLCFYVFYVVISVRFHN